MPGSNTSAWVEFSGVNAMRLFTNATQYEPNDDLGPFGDGVNDLASFNARKDALRNDPLNSTFINWAPFEDRFANRTLSGTNRIQTDYAFGELHDLGIHVLPVSTRSANSYPIAGPTDWAGQWEQWQYYYAFAFHTARHFDVSQFQMYNEPNRDSNIDQSSYVMRLQLASDAMRSAIEDVNRIYDKDLVADVAAPVTAGGSTRVDDWGRAALEAIRTDYQGQPVDYDMFNTYAAQVYTRTGATMANDIAGIHSKIPLYHAGGSAAGEAMPVMISEFNRYTTAQFASRPVDLETPSILADIGSIFVNSTLQGVDSLYAFKFSQTVSNGQAQETGFHYVQNSGTFDITGATRSAGVVRLFAKGFSEHRALLDNAVSSDGTYNFTATFDPSSNNYYAFAVNHNDSESHEVTIDLSEWNVAPGTIISVEEVSSLHSGAVTQMISVPQDRQITVTQPSESVWLLSVPSGPQQQSVALTPSDDASVRNSDGTSGGEYRTQNFGYLSSATVGRDPNSAESNYCTYLQFNVDDFTADRVSRAILQLTGSSSEGLIPLNVYALAEDGWSEDGIAWSNAPNLLSNDAKITGVGATAFPVGILLYSESQATWGLDITQFLRNHADLFDDGMLSFALAREERFAGDLDLPQSYVELFTRESAYAPQLLLFVPEPGALALLAVGAVCVAAWRLRRGRRKPDN